MCAPLTRQLQQQKSSAPAGTIIQSSTIIQFSPRASRTRAGRSSCTSMSTAMHQLCTARRRTAKPVEGRGMLDSPWLVWLLTTHASRSGGRKDLALHTCATLCHCGIAAGTPLRLAFSRMIHVLVLLLDRCQRLHGPIGTCLYTMVSCLVCR